MKVGLGLGSNVGDRLRHLQDARAFLAGLSPNGGLLCSPLYETAPIACPAGSAPFLNAVLEIEFAGQPAELLALTQQYERAQGRDPQAGRNAPRPIDIDILYCDAGSVTEKNLSIPHPRLAERRFVLEPLATIRPAQPVPGTGQTVSQMLARLPAGHGEIRVLQQDW